MWPGTGMLIAGGLTALVLKWRMLDATFTHAVGEVGADAATFPLKLGRHRRRARVDRRSSIVQYVFFDLPIWMTLSRSLLSVPLMLVGLRVLGETNWGPISQLTNMMQALFAGARARATSTANMAASGTTGTIAVQSEAIMQDYKAGHIIGSTPRFLTYSQLIAAPIGALAVALVYPLLRRHSTASAAHGLVVADLDPHRRLRRGSRRAASSALPTYALEFLVIGAVLGILDHARRDVHEVAARSGCRRRPASASA